MASFVAIDQQDDMPAIVGSVADIAGIGLETDTGLRGGRRGHSANCSLSNSLSDKPHYLIT